MAMNYIYLQPANTRFEWELEVAINNLLDLKVDPSSIWLVFSKEKAYTPRYLYAKYGVNVFVYDDERTDKGYIPSIRPYLWMQFLNGNPEMQMETFCYLDSDTVFRELPDWDNVLPKLGANTWYGADCSSYLDISYIESKGEDLFDEMVDSMDLPDRVAVMKASAGTQDVIGATWVISQPQASFWEQAYYNTNDLYNFLARVEPDYIRDNKLQDANYVPIQKWTAEMWAVLWTAWEEGINTIASPELSFSWATDGGDSWYQHKLFHNAGVVNKDMGVFYKGAYLAKTPYQDILDNKVPITDKASQHYVEMIKQVASSLGDD